MNCHSDEIDNPPLQGVYCDGCGAWYSELAALVWGKRVKLIARLLCINCDPDSNQPACTGTATAADRRK